MKIDSELLPKKRIMVQDVKECPSGKDVCISAVVKETAATLTEGAPIDTGRNVGLGVDVVGGEGVGLGMKEVEGGGVDWVDGEGEGDGVG